MGRLRDAVDSIGEVATLYGVLLLVAATLFSLIEGIPFEKALYWAAITSTTVGYGDISPKTIPGELIAAFTALGGIVVVALLTAHIMGKVMKDDHKLTHEEQEEIKADLAETKALLTEIKEMMKNG